MRTTQLFLKLIFLAGLLPVLSLGCKSNQTCSDGSCGPGNYSAPASPYGTSQQTFDSPTPTDQQSFTDSAPQYSQPAGSRIPMTQGSGSR